MIASVATPALAQTSPPLRPTTTPAPAAAKPAAPSAPAATPAPAAAKPATTPAAAPAPPVVSNAPPVARVDDWPTGAPRTDYEFTAWCYGVLRTHMELYNQVKPELAAISKRWKTEEEDEKSYADQLAAGRMYLAEFAKAIELTEKASPRPINAQGAAAIESGRKMWAQFNTVDKTNQAYSWMNWELPEKCPKVAKTLADKSLLMTPALKANTPSSAAAQAAAGAKPAEAPKPADNKSAAVKPDPVGALITDAGKKDATVKKP
jgi:hypothetical protein